MTDKNSDRISRAQLRKYFQDAVGIESNLSILKDIRNNLIETHNSASCVILLRTRRNQR